jgi:hypothetical protein
LGFQEASLLGVETQNSGEASLRYVRRNAALPTGVIFNPPYISWGRMRNPPGNIGGRIFNFPFIDIIIIKDNINIPDRDSITRSEVNLG